MADNQGKGRDIVYLLNRLHLFDRLGDVLAANGNMEEKLSNEISDMRGGNASDQALWSKYAYLEHRIGNVSRQAMLAMVLSWLEAALDLVADALRVENSANDPHRSNQKWFTRLLRPFAKRASEAKGGSEFRKRVNLLREAGISFDDVEGECQQTDDLVAIRNCCVHAAGMLDRYSKKKRRRVENAVGRFRRKVGEEEIKGQSHSRNMRLVRIDGGFLYLEENLIGEAVIISQEIVHHCIKAVTKLDGSAQ